MSINFRYNFLQFIFIVLLSSIILSIYLVLAPSPYDVSYNSMTQTLTFSLAGNHIVSLTLNTPLDYPVFAGKDRKVAELTINSSINFNKSLDSMEFRDIKKFNSLISRDFVFKKKVIVGYYNTSEHQNQCDQKLLENSSLGDENCTLILINERQNELIQWQPLGKDLNLSKGLTTIGIFTDVNIGDNVDWLPNILSNRIDQWASWNETYNQNLKAYWKLNESSGTNALDSVGAGLYNGTILNMQSLGASGLIGTSYQFNNDSRIDLSLSMLNGSVGNVTMSMWVYLNNNQSVQNIWSLYDSSDSRPECDFYIEDGITFYCFDSGGADFNTGTIKGINTSIWHNFVMQWTNDSTGNATLWMDGSVLFSDSSVDFRFGDALDRHVLGNITASGDTKGSFRGYMDEVSWWDTYLSPSLIVDLYNDRAGITYEPFPPLDTITPNTTTPIITPIQPKSNQNLNCNATLTDNLQTNLTAFWKWYKNNELNLSGSTNGIQNGTINASITILDSGNTTKGEVWICEVKPFDGFNNGTAKNSSGVTILNSAPIHNNPILTTPTGKNLSTENLTCSNQTTSDADNDPITNIYNWYKNSQSIAVLNLPFEINAEDYSSNNNDGIIEGAIFTNGTGGRALEFDGIDDFVNLSRPASLVSLDTTLSVEAWVFSDNNTGQHLIFDECEFFATKGYCLLMLDNEFRFHAGLVGAPKATAGGIQTGKWYHVIGTYDNTSIKIYVNGSLINTTSAIGPLNKNGDEDIIIGHNSPLQTNDFDGKIDEVRVYNIALTAEQVKQRYEETKNGLTSSSKIVNQETLGGNVWMCQVTPNDGEIDGTTLNSTNLSVLWGITFNVTDSFSNASLNNVIINCTAPNFNQGGDTINPYGPFGFSPGTYTCTFEEAFHFDKTVIFNADNDKVVSVKMSEQAGLTIEEHTWLEAIHNCINGGNCALYNLLLEVNKTVGNIWEHTKPTDETIITFENVTNKILNVSNNLTIDYRVNIPIKAGYSLGTYLPIRIGFWFLDTTNTSCFNQGDKPTGVSDPYCQPLITEVIGPMGGSVNFTVKLRPSLPAGNYSIKRIIDIDPNNIWINYGQETIGIITLTESLNNFGISLEKTGEIIPIINSGGSSSSSSSTGSSGGDGGGGGTTIIKEKEIIKLVTQEDEDKNEKSGGDKTEIDQGAGITGGVIEASLLSGGQITIIVAILAGVFVVFIIITSRTILKLKKK